MNNFLFPGAEKIQAAYTKMIASGQLNEENLRGCVAQQMLDIGINLAGSCYGDARSNMAPPYPGEKPPGFFNLPISERLALGGAFIAAEMDRIELERAAAIILEQDAAHLTGGPSVEETIVGWLLRNGHDIANCAEVCTATSTRHFSPEDLEVSIVFACCLQLINQSRPCTIADVQESLADANYLDNAGGPMRLMEIASHAATRERVIEILAPATAAAAPAPAPVAALPPMNSPGPPMNLGLSESAVPAMEIPAQMAGVPSEHIEQAVLNPAALSNDQLQAIAQTVCRQLITNADGGTEFLPVIENNGQRFVIGHQGSVVAPQSTPPPQPRPAPPSSGPDFPDWLAGGIPGG